MSAKFNAAVIDFNKSSKQMLTKLLRTNKNIEAESPGNLAEAKTLLSSGTIDILIIDQDLGETDCFTWMEQTQDVINWESIAKVILTSDGSEANLARAVEMGFQRVLSRPFTMATAEIALKPFMEMYTNPTPALTYLKNLNKIIGTQAFDEALAFFQNNPPPEKNNPEISYKMAFVYYRLNRFSDAEPLLKEILQSNANFLRGLVLLSKVLVGKKEYEEAYLNISKAVSISPNNIERIILATAIAVRSRHYEDVMRYAGIAENASWTDKDVLTHLIAALIVEGLYLASTGERDKAFACLEQGAALSVKNPELFHLGVRSMVEATKLNNSPKLDNIVAAQIKGHENDTDFIFIRAMQEFNAGNWTKAATYLTRIKNELKWRDLGYSLLSECYTKMEKPEKATQTIEEANSLGAHILSLSEIQHGLIKKAA